MSKEDVVRFMQKVNSDPNLAKRITAAARTATAWVEKGSEVGFRFSSDELRTVSEELLGKRLTGDAFIAELLASSTSKGELDAASLDGVTGGAGVTAPVFATSIANNLGNIGTIRSNDHIKISEMGGGGGIVE